jgi:hypothetical protein
VQACWSTTHKKKDRRARSARRPLLLVKFFLDRLVGQLARVDSEPPLEHLRVLLVVVTYASRVGHERLPRRA